MGRESPGEMADWLRSVGVAVGFLTRFPVPGGQVDPRTFGRAVAWFPLAGALLGATLLIVDWSVRDRLPVALEAVALVALLAWLSGGLHLDGLADVFDGLSGGGGDRSRTLEIMRDSRIGAHGATALSLTLLLKAVALTELLRQGNTWALLTFPASARFGASALLFAFPRATPEGLGASFNRDGQPRYLILGMATLVAIIVTGASADRALPLVLTASSMIGLVVAFLFAARVSSRLGGLTGDVYGACIEIAEVGFLVAACWGGAR